MFQSPPTRCQEWEANGNIMGSNGTQFLGGKRRDNPNYGGDAMEI